MKTMDLDTSKEPAAVQEEAVMEKKKKKIRTDCKTTELQICSKESEDAAVVEDQAAGIMEGKKFCTVCRTTKTPLWRVGPSGPKSLCNACGIRYRKKMPLSAPASNSGGSQCHDEEAEKEKETSKCSSKSTVKMSLVILGKDWFVETTSSVGKKKKQRRLRERRKLREEEIAAASLVALSSGSVFV